MSLPAFDLTTRAQLVKSSGIILDRDLLPVFQAIEALSSRSNITKGGLFKLTEERIASLKINPDGVGEVLKDLIDFKLIAQIFEVKYDPDNPKLKLETFFICETESLRDPGSCYEVYIEKSAKAIHQFCKERSIADTKLLHRIVYNLSAGNEDGFGTEFQSLFAVDKFIVPPPDLYLNQYIADLKYKLNAHNNLIGDLTSSLYYMPEEDASEALNIFRNSFEAKLLPILRLKNQELDTKIEALESQESIDEKNIDYKGDWEFIRNISKLCLDYPKQVGDSGRLLIESIVKLSIESESHYRKKEKSERDRMSLQILKELDSGNDLDTLFLRANLEDYISIPRSVIDVLTIDREVLSCEWYTPTHKLAIFAKNKPENLKKINNIIFNEYKNTTDYILYFRTLLEYNEKEITGIFKDSEFVRVYGKSLQEAYLRYIPFFYKIFAWLGIQSIINSGYAKAKSIIKFQQMDRQFQYEKRYQKRAKERLEERLEELARKELIKYKDYLVNALEDFYFIEATIPSSEEISNQYPALIPVMLEKAVKEYHFRVIENGGFTSGNLILFPDSEEWEEKNQAVKSLAIDLASKNSSSNSEIGKRASLVKKFLP